MRKTVVIELLRKYFSTQPVLKAWLFGSFSRGEETQDSDVDIIVSLDKSKPIGLKFFGMWSDLEELLGRKVDLVSEGTLLPFAKESAERDKILYCCPLKLFIQNKLGLTLLTKYQPF